MTLTNNQISSRVLLSDLNDFISPTLECIKPTKQENHVEMNFKLNAEVEKDEFKNDTKKLVEINLSDCLACSGCITSAETVLISIQSNKEFYRILHAKNNQSSAMTMPQENDALQDEIMHVDDVLQLETIRTETNQMEESKLEQQFKIIVVSISSQSRASLANKFGFSSMEEIWIVLSNLFTSLGVDYVFDIDYARDISLLASGCEFMTRFTSSKEIPVLTSSCPGWVCYAEKTHPMILPYLDTTKSPQQIMGSIVKHFMAKKVNVNPNEICHVSIMPCYDKKLEASREDFYNDLYSSRDVDLVLSTLEVEQILLDKNISIHQIPKNTLLKQPIFPFVKVSNNGRIALSSGSSSGGYLDWVLRYAVKCLYNVTLTLSDIQQGLNGISITPGRNSDFTTITFTPEGCCEPTLRFAYVYGFKNIQNLVRKLKTKQRTASPPFHFVEVMACPQGCINGGAQSRHDPSLLPTKEWIHAVDQLYSKPDRDLVDSADNVGIHQLLAEWVGSDYVSQMENQTSAMRGLFHTRFHAVENHLSDPNAGLLVKW